MIGPGGLLLVVPRVSAVPPVSVLKVGFEKKKSKTKLVCKKVFFAGSLRY
jgi:hypothetical protein